MTSFYDIPDYVTAPKDRHEVAANMAHLLLANGHGIFDTTELRMTAADQRRVFGLFLGKGSLVIDGGNDRVSNMSVTCFGMDREATVYLDCPSGTVGRNFGSPLQDSKREKEINAAKEWFKP